MRLGTLTRSLLTAASLMSAAATPAMAAQAVAAAQARAIPRAIVRIDQWAYDRGYRQGLREGRHDADANRRAQPARDVRGAGLTDFAIGYRDGYRVGYDRARGVLDRRDRDDQTLRRGLRVYQEPASARGYSDGYEQGVDDGNDRDRYDPVRQKDYRQGDQGYYREYGSRDAYKNNYRAGYRQGYEDGYRSERR